MHFLENYYETVVKYELVNKFNYITVKDIPKLKKIVLNFGYTNSNIINITSAVLALKMITKNLPLITTSKDSRILLKIRKGQPVGCKIILRNYYMYNFLFTLIAHIFPNLKNFKGIKVKTPFFNINTVSYTLKDIYLFEKLEQNYQFIRNLPDLNIIFVVNSKTDKELLYLLNSFKLPLNIKYLQM